MSKNFTFYVITQCARQNHIGIIKVNSPEVNELFDYLKGSYFHEKIVIAIISHDSRQVWKSSRPILPVPAHQNIHHNSPIYFKTVLDYVDLNIFQSSESSCVLFLRLKSGVEMGWSLTGVKSKGAYEDKLKDLDLQTVNLAQSVPYKGFSTKEKIEEFIKAACAEKNIDPESEPCKKVLNIIENLRTNKELDEQTEAMCWKELAKAIGSLITIAL